MSRLVFAFLSTSIHFMLFHTFMNLPGQIGYNWCKNLNSKGCQENVLNIISLSFLVKSCLFLEVVVQQPLFISLLLSYIPGGGGGGGGVLGAG